MDKQREEFEKWAKNNGYHVSRCGVSGMYVSMVCDNAWQAWQEAQKVAVPEWISVEDRLPEFDKKVLVCVNGYEIYIDEYIDRGYAEYFVVWHDCVTHWQPLPNPPKDIEND